MKQINEEFMKSNREDVVHRRSSIRMGFHRIPAASVIVLLLVGLMFGGCRRDRVLNIPPPASQAATTSIGVRTTFADIVSRVAPAVVTIRTQMRVRAPQQFPFMDDPFFRRFFGQRAPEQPEQRATGLGSGVIVTNDGYI